MAKLIGPNTEPTGVTVLLTDVCHFDYTIDRESSFGTVECHIGPSEAVPKPGDTIQFERGGNIKAVVRSVSPPAISRDRLPEPTVIHLKDIETVANAERTSEEREENGTPPPDDWTRYVTVEITEALFSDAPQHVRDLIAAARRHEAEQSGRPCNHVLLKLIP